ncbi:hypothetical protein [Acidovorax sp. NCPPB 3576]|uniref:hypothetical protein n=1 Tax=Acidovorax sp. NCPPB 3576 TaxID=2940488 RepID=UPI002349A589|nr:hypothetical protein [Acidovorax sp. NCPPB 3576]WCM89879.1 hypothetical protein M5C98_07600 [Acidovorax sp. NCPPB 3576]
MPSWTSFKKDSDKVVQGCRVWAEFLEQVIERAEKSTSPPTLSLCLYHYGDLPYGLAKAFESKEYEYISSLQLIENNSESVNFYIGLLAWSGENVAIGGEDFINRIFGDFMHYVGSRHFFEHRKLYDKSCEILGLESVILKISNPGSDSEAVELYHRSDKSTSNRPAKLLSDFLNYNQAFLADLSAFLRARTFDFGLN